MVCRHLCDRENEFGWPFEKRDSGIRLFDLCDPNEDIFNLAFERRLRSLKNPPKTAEELLQILASQGLEKTIGKLGTFRDQF